MRRVTHSHWLTPFRTPPPLPGRSALQPHRGAAVPSRSRPWCQTKFPGLHRPLTRRVPLLPLTHLLTDCAARGAGEDARAAPGWDTTGQESVADAFAAPENFLRAAERGRGPGPPLPGRQHQLHSASDAAPGPRWESERSGPAAQPARLLNESSAPQGSCSAPPPASRPLAPPPTSEPRLVTLSPAPLSGRRAQDSPARPCCSASPPLEPSRNCRGLRTTTDWRRPGCFSMHMILMQQKEGRHECCSGPIIIACVTRVTAATS